MPVLVGGPIITDAVSSDGVVTAARDEQWASVDVTIDWQAAMPLPWQTTVVRTNPDGSKVIVRSGDLMFTPGGDGFAYDHEAPLEGSVSYQAFGYSYTGALVQTSTSATLTLPAASKAAWLKSVANPSLSMLVKVRTSLEESWDQPTIVFEIPGSRYDVIWGDVQKAMSGIIRTRTKSKAEYTAIRALVGSGVLLLQGSEIDNAFPYDAYIRPVGALSTDRPGDMPGYGLRWPSFRFQEVARPETAGWPLRVPNWTNEIVASSYATYAAFDAAFATYVAQAKGP